MERYGGEELPPDPDGWDLDRQSAAGEGVDAGDYARPEVQSWTVGVPLLEVVPGQCYAHYAQHFDDL